MKNKRLFAGILAMALSIVIAVPTVAETSNEQKRDMSITLEKTEWMWSVPATIKFTDNELEKEGDVAISPIAGQKIFLEEGTEILIKLKNTTNNFKLKFSNQTIDYKIALTSKGDALSTNAEVLKFNAGNSDVSGISQKLYFATTQDQILGATLVGDYTDTVTFEINVTEIVDEGATKGLTYSFNADNQSYTVTGRGEATDKDIVVSSTYKGLPVTGIGDNAFNNDVKKDCYDITTIRLPKTIKVIGEAAFWCPNMTTLTFAEDTSLTSVGKKAFRNNKNLKKLDLPAGLTSIPEQMCELCDVLEEIKLPEGITSISTYAFANNLGALKTIYLPKSLTSIAQYAFDGCNSITTVYYAGKESEKNTLFSNIADQGTSNLKTTTWNCIE